MAEIKSVATSCNYSVNDIKNLKPLDILLIGKTGNGKSALGNMILGRHIFKSKSSTISVTKEVEYDWVSFDNYLLKIVDAPGVSDTDNIKDFDKATQMIIDKMKHAVTFSPAGYHAFLLVVRYGNRFTAEDNFCIKMLKSIFGQDFVKNFCILIVTCGDLFITENPEISFSEWCKEQEGIFVELLQECDMRVLLFNNKSKDEKVRNEQVRKLIEEVEHLQTGGRRYTDKHFAEMAEDREKFILECKEPLIKEEILIHVNLIMRDLEELYNLEKEDQANKLNELNERARTLQKDVTENDRGTGILQQSIENIKGLLVLIGDKINFLNEYTSLKQDLSQDHLKTENEPDEIENNSNIKSKSCSWRSDHAIKSEEIEVNTSKKRIDKDVIAFQKNSPIKSSTRKTHSQYKIDSKINKDADDQQQTQSLEPVSVKCLSEKFDDIVRSKTTRPTPRSSVRTKSQQGEKETDFLEKEKEITKLQGRLIATQDLALKLMSDKDEREERLRNEVQLKLDQMALYLECKRLLDETMKTVSDRKKSRCRLS